MLFLDTETTGLDPQHDRITQVALVGDDGATWQTLVNPGRPIPPEIQQLTRITDEMVADAPPFAAIAAELSGRLAGQVLVGFGCWGLDIPMLAEEFERAGVEYSFDPQRVIDVGALFKLAKPRTLAAAVETYLGESSALAPCLDPIFAIEFRAAAHGAVADAEATRRVYNAMRTVEPLVCSKSPDELAMLSCHGKPPGDPFGKLVRIDGALCFNTHRNRGVPVADDTGYAEWMLNADFPMATKRVLRAELRRVYDLEQELDEEAGLFDFLPAAGD